MFFVHSLDKVGVASFDGFSANFKGRSQQPRLHRQVIAHQGPLLDAFPVIQLGIHAVNVTTNRFVDSFRFQGLSEPEVDLGTSQQSFGVFRIQKDERRRKLAIVCNHHRLLHQRMASKFHFYRVRTYVLAGTRLEKFL